MAYHHGNLREALIEAAVALVDAGGPEAVSVRAVARQAGVSSGAPFRHFSDKAALMGAVAEDGVAKLQDAMMAAMAEAGDAPAERFRAMGVAYVRFAVAHRGHFRVMNNPEYATDGVRAAIESSRSLMRAMIEAGQAAGAIRATDPEAMMLAAHAMVYGVARCFVDGLFALQGIDDGRAGEIAELVTDQLGLGFAQPGIDA